MIKSMCVKLLIFSIIAICSFVTSPRVSAEDFTSCGGDFNSFLNRAGEHAFQLGVSEKVISKTIEKIHFNPKIIELDRKQSNFKLSFLDFSNRAINEYRLVNGKKKFKQHSDVFSKALSLFGVPKEVISAFWAMETDFGAVQGNFNTLNSLATLAFDCRRPELFQPELIAAMKLVQRGDLKFNTTGAWAGEIGQVQMLPTDILQFGFDGDGDGKILLKESPEDAILTAAGLIRHMGWIEGYPWLEEVTVPKNFPWEFSGFGRQKSLKEWKKLGILLRGDELLDFEHLPSTLLLPQGRKGPAFLAFENFYVYLKWNDSFIYTVTAAQLAKRLSGAKKYIHKNPPGILDINSMIKLQKLLKKEGYDVGKVDGILGARTRQSVRSVQMKFGLPADSWPTYDLLKKLKNR